MIVPNAFQCPNVFIDQAMPYLTASEFRVLMFATRHIMGWQDKIKKRKGAISLTMFENGFTTAEGKRYQGCGLGKRAIIDALDSLVTFGFLSKENEPTPDGQMWGLHEDGILWKELIARTDATQDKRRRQTEKARAAADNNRLGGVSNNTSVVEHTGAGVSNSTMQGVVEHTQSKPSSKSSSKPFAQARKTSKSTPNKSNPAIHALINAWAKAAGYGLSGESMYTDGRGKKAKEMLNLVPSVTPAEIVEFVEEEMRGRGGATEFVFLPEKITTRRAVKNHKHSAALPLGMKEIR